MKKLALLLISLTLILSFALPAKADIYFTVIDESSSIFTQSENLLSIENADVKIDCRLPKDDRITEDRGDYKMRANFTIKNNQNSSFKALFYLKAKAHRSDNKRVSAEVDVIFVINKGKQSERRVGGEVVNINGQKYPSFEYFFGPYGQVDIEVISGFSSLELPFYYYLDELDSYSTLKYEKIAIEGFCDASFNEHYPVELISEDNGFKKWVWEYSNLNVKDSNLKDVLKITESKECKSEWECEEWKDYPDPNDNCEYRNCYDNCGNRKTEYRNCETGIRAWFETIINWFSSIISWLKNLF
ncbi:hypothetical protein HQ544_04870 [Candidatus Falkowbacteria bacterium]|nr:hypothetical protein [Candidatus Falkowbacteria bacterium]